MQRTILLKYTSCFLAILLLLFIVLNTFGSSEITKTYMHNREESLYRQAELISDEFATKYYSSDITLPELGRQLQSVATMNQCRIWITNAKGVLLIDSDSSMYNFPINVFSLDPDIPSYTIQSGVMYPDQITEPMIMAVNSILYDYTTKG